MTQLLAVLVLSGLSAQAQTITETFGSGANQFTIDFVTIGNPGNTADTGFILTDPPTSYTAGSVNYIYRIGKYEVSRDQISKVNNLSNLGIQLFDIEGSWGIANGNSPDKPALGISWNRAARFVNWLNTSRGYQAAYNFTTTGVNDKISLWSTGQHVPGNQYRHKDALYFLPNVDEWYKAAYGSPSGTWFDYPTGTDLPPIPVSEGTSAGTSVFNQDLNNRIGPADVMNAGGLSAYGTMAQGGNAIELIETELDGVNDLPGDNLQVRGGNWMLDEQHQPAWHVELTGPYETGLFGFRVAMVPEPSSLSLLVAGGAVLMAGRRRG